MSLLNEAMETFILMNKQVTDDGYGGYYTSYTDGISFKAALAFNTSMSARTAEKQGVTSLYTVITSKALTLEYHDILKRQKDGKIFRVTSDGDDKYTPESASLDMREVTAEEYVIGGDKNA